MIASAFNEPLMESTAVLDERLSVARALLLRQRRAAIAARATRSAATVALVGAVVVAVMVVARLLGWINFVPVLLTLVVWASAWTWILLRGGWQAWRCEVGLMETAQRVDRACGCQNRLASALEFREAKVIDGWRWLAIEDAIRHLPLPDAMLSVLPKPEPVRGLLPKLILLATCVLAITFMLRLHPYRGDSRTPPNGLSGAMIWFFEPGHIASSKQSGSENIPATADRSWKIRSAFTNGTDSSAASNSALNGDHQPKSARSTPGAAGVGHQQSAASGADRQNGSAQTSPQASAGDSSRNQSPQLSLPQFSDADMQSGASNRSSSAGLTASLAGMGQSQDQSPGSGASQTNSSKSGSQQANQNASNENKSPQSGQSGQNQADMKQAAGGQGGQNQDSTGGQGSGSGTSGAKKSRGAGTGLLGVRTADLFPGRELPGPDQKSTIPTRPTPGDQSPAAADAASNRREDETTTDMTRIVPDDDAFIDDYFSRLHQPPGSPGPAAKGDILGAGE